MSVAHGRVESVDGRKTGLALHAIQLSDEGLDRVGLVARRLLDAIFAVQPRHAVLVEDLPGDLSWLCQNGPSELGIGSARMSAPSSKKRSPSALTTIPSR